MSKLRQALARVVRGRSAADRPAQSGVTERTRWPLDPWRDATLCSLVFFYVQGFRLASRRSAVRSRHRPHTKSPGAELDQFVSLKLVTTPSSVQSGSEYCGNGRMWVERMFLSSF
jgi:hypothetical protein